MSSSSYAQLQRLEQLIRRRDLTKIPKDQQALLDRSESWAVHLKDQPHGMVQVPGHVLQTARDAHFARRTGLAKGDDGHSRENRGDEEDSDSDVGPPRPQHGNGSAHRAQRRSTSPAPAAPSSPERAMSWTPSPSRSQVQKRDMVQSSIVKETPKAAPLEAKPPAPGSTPMPQAVPALTMTPVDNEDDDLEMEIPQAQTRFEVPINRQASSVPQSSSILPSSLRTMNTPPCAQPPPFNIPSTDLEPQSSPLRPLPQSKRPFRRHKPHNLEDPVEKRGPSVTSKPQPAQRASVVGVNGSGQTSTSESSSAPALQVIPATITDTQPPRQGNGQPGEQKPSNRQGTVHIHDIVSSSMKDQPGPAEAVGGGPREVRMAHPAQHFQPVSTIPPERAPPPAAPFETFCRAYPDYLLSYKGSLWKFVQACLCLEYLATGKDLRECLFDDFIRAFSGGYLEYVQSVDADEALPAVNWFNGLEGSPIFSHLVVQRNNLPDILGKFPEQVAKLRGSIDDGTRDSAHQPSGVYTQGQGHRLVTDIATKASATHQSSQAALESVATSTGATLNVAAGATTRDAQHASKHRNDTSKIVAEDTGSGTRSTSKPVAGDLRGDDAIGADTKQTRQAQMRRDPTQESQTADIITQLAAPPSPELGFDSTEMTSTPSILARPLKVPDPIAQQASGATLGRKRPAEDNRMQEQKLPRRKPALSAESESTAPPMAPPRSSRYFQRRVSEHPPSSAARTSEERARLREHFLKKKSSRSDSISSSGAGSR